MPQSVIFCVKGLLNKPFAECVSHLANLAGPLPELGRPALVQAARDPSQPFNKPVSFDGCLDGGWYQSANQLYRSFLLSARDMFWGIDACGSLIYEGLLLGWCFILEPYLWVWFVQLVFLQGSPSEKVYRSFYLLILFFSLQQPISHVIWLSIQII